MNQCIPSKHLHQGAPLQHKDLQFRSLQKKKQKRIARKPSIRRLFVAIALSSEQSTGSPRIQQDIVTCHHLAKVNFVNPPIT
jgi:hypothetical protein